MRFAHQETFPARRGTGERASPRKGRSFSRIPSPLRSPNEPFHARNGDTLHLIVRTRPSSCKTFHFVRPWQTRRFTSRVSSPPHFAANIQRAPQAQLSAPAKSQLSALPAAVSSPHHPAGRPAGSARTRSRVQPLENPFFGNASVFLHLRLPSPKTPQAAGPCSWACRRLPAPPPHPTRNAEHPPPARGVGVRLHGANGTGSRHCRAPSTCRPCRRRRRGWRPVPARECP